MDLLPLFLKLRDRECLVVGGGTVALRKIELLLEAGAAVSVVAPELHPGVRNLVDIKRIRQLADKFTQEMLEHKALVIAATDDAGVNHLVSELATARNIPVNVVDRPELCSVIFPAIVDRSPLLIAVGSNGSAPVLARKLRQKLESWIPAGYARLAALGGRFRQELKQQLPALDARRRFWESVFGGRVENWLLDASEEQGLAILRRHLEKTRSGLETAQGEVYLVGAGPGDPDLLSFKALRLLQQADIVLHDYLVPDEILALARRDAEKIYVGKRCKIHSTVQSEINALMVEYARAGKRVCRLKGGDPFIFGRGGEELETLAEAGIPFQVVPGITAASGCAAYAGIPLTHRDHAQSLLFVTGHLKREGEFVLDGLDWPALVRPNQTVVFYMGFKTLPLISRQLQAHGMAADMPAAIVEHGTRPEQRVLSGTIGTLPQIAEAAHIDTPALIIVGHVVTLRNKLDWIQQGANPV
ncbi:MAG TPA: siroheme synthase CysG [Gammaproteobacteria bacterium]|nr:siroheme synthase CysG [Gammaproteobacteria bacterium]